MNAVALKPSYQTRDPKGWMGDPRRGAALGRSSLHEADPETEGPFYLRKVRLLGDYDANGTYFGYSRAAGDVYWYAFTGDDGEEVDATLRAHSRDEAKAIVRERYPLARFYDEPRRSARPQQETNHVERL